KTIKGQTNWYQFAGISLQPSEFAKIGTALLLSKYISDTQTTFQTLKEQGIALGIIFLPVMFILLQPDAGSAMIFVSLFLVLNREGFPTWYLWTGAFFIVGFILALIIPPLYLSLLIVLGFGVHFYFNKRISRSEEHTSELQSRENLVCRLLLEIKKLICLHV